jgi:hypothetical protein
MTQSMTNTHPTEARLFPQKGDTFGLIVQFGKGHVVLSVYVRLKRQKHYDLFSRQRFETIAAAKVVCALLDDTMQVVIVKNDF